jgi:pimeloyl-ACP methyl ester carboxylesterase
MEKVRIDGAELEYEVVGTGEPVIFIHGAFIADAFRPLLSEHDLTDRYRLILYHRRGYAGSSGADGSGAIVEQVDDCRALLHHLDIELAHVVGHSYGGAVALQLALDAPEVVHSLALLEPALMVGGSAQGYRDSLLQSLDRFRQGGAETVVDAFMEARWPGYRPVLDRILPGAFDQAVADAGTTFGELPGLLAWTFGVAEARRVTQPVLSVLGGESGALSPRFAEAHAWMLASMPHAETAVLPGTTHMMQVQDSRATAGALAAFWARHAMAQA